VNGWFVVPRDRGGSELLSGSPGAFFRRAVQAMFGIYGVDPEEAVYFPSRVDAEGEVIDGSQHDYVLRLPIPPPNDGFWSLTLYDSATEFLVPSAINRYAIGDRTEGLHYDADGGLTLYLQNAETSVPEQRANWLPAPDRPILAVLRVYIPTPAVVEAEYIPPAIQKNVRAG